MKQSVVGRDDVKLTDAWDKLIENLIDENKRLPNGKFFLDQGGIKLLLKCRKNFPLNTALKEELLLAICNISYVKELRPQLLSKKVGDTLLPMIFEFFKANVCTIFNYIASITLANLISEGKIAWKNSQSYNDALKQLDALPTKWDNSVKFEYIKSNFKTISLLLESPQCQYFGLWALKAHTTKSCCKYKKYYLTNFTFDLSFNCLFTSPVIFVGFCHFY